MTEETKSSPTAPDNISTLSLVSEFINNEMAEDNRKLADPFTPQLGEAVSTGGGGGGGVVGLREELQSRGEETGQALGPPATSLPPLDLSEGNKTEGYRSARIEELMDTLECPVCLDTADTPPVYQCPEGHLICKDCNAKMVECPQCGHSLMNARNRYSIHYTVYSTIQS